MASRATAERTGYSPQPAGQPRNDPAASDAERLAAARAWGDWATAQGRGPRPPLRPLDGRPLRVGYDTLRIADRPRLAELRNGMRTRMRASPLMEVGGFTRGLEDALIELCRDIEARGEAR